MPQPVVRRTWAPKGQTPVHYSWDRRDCLSVISVITVSPDRRRLGLYFDVHDDNLDPDAFEAFVRWLRHRIRKGMALVVDCWSVHRSGARRLQTRLGSRVRVEWPPAYAPDLNPVERVWSHPQPVDLANHIPDDVDAPAAAVVRSIEQTGCRQTLLRSFFHHAGIKL